MRKGIFSLGLLMVLMSCGSKGDSYLRLSGDELALPPELKGLKVYSVCVDGGDFIKVAILNGQVNSSTYYIGKSTETAIMLNPAKKEARVIEYKEIMSETEDIIVIRKK